MCKEKVTFTAIPGLGAGLGPGGGKVDECKCVSLGVSEGRNWVC